MADLRITHVSVLLEDGTILKDQNVDVTDGRFSGIAPAEKDFSESAACAAASLATNENGSGQAGYSPASSSQRTFPNSSSVSVFFSSLLPLNLAKYFQGS